MPKFEGVTVKIGEEEFVVPPLNFFRLKKIEPLIAKINDLQTGTLPTGEQIDAITMVIHSALSRNYPHLTIENVEEMVDLGNLERIIRAVMAVSGFVPGEKPAGSDLTGIKSTPT